MAEDFEIITPHEDQIDKLTRIIAVLIDRAGGEVVISKAEFEAFESVAVVGRAIARDYVRFRLAEEDEEVIVTETNLPEEPSQV